MNENPYEIPAISPISTIIKGDLGEQHYIIGISPLQTTINHSTLRTGVIIVIIIISIIVLILLIIVFFAPTKSTQFDLAVPNKIKSPIPPPSFNIYDNPGQSPNGMFNTSVNCQNLTSQVSCEANERGFWNPISPAVQPCQCLSPFWSSNGEREAFSDSYFGVGIPSLGDVNVTLLKTIDNVSRLSFVPNNRSEQAHSGTCTGICDSDEKCIGVLWDKTYGKCSLLGNEVNVNPGRTIVFKPHEDSTLYMKNEQRPLFKNNVFLYTDWLPQRFWLLWEFPNFKQVVKNVVYGLNFTPHNTINDGNLTGIYSIAVIEPTNISDLLVGNIEGEGELFVIHRPGKKLDIPAEWDYQKHRVSVVYV